LEFECFCLGNHALSHQEIQQGLAIDIRREAGSGNRREDAKKKNGGSNEAHNPGSDEPLPNISPSRCSWTGGMFAIKNSPSRFLTCTGRVFPPDYRSVPVW
jgi:hypothetical protein